MLKQTKLLSLKSEAHKAKANNGHKQVQLGTLSIYTKYVLHTTWITENHPPKYTRTLEIYAKRLRHSFQIFQNKYYKMRGQHSRCTTK